MKNAFTFLCEMPQNIYYTDVLRLKFTCQLYFTAEGLTKQF